MFEELITPMGEEGSSGDEVRCRFFFFGGDWRDASTLLTPLPATSAVVVREHKIATPLLRLLCSPHPKICSCDCPLSPFLSKWVCKKFSNQIFLNWKTFQGMHELICVCSVGADGDSPRWTMLGICGWSRIKMDPAGRGPVARTHDCLWLRYYPLTAVFQRHQGQTEDDQFYVFLYENKVVQRLYKVVWCGFHWSG